MIFDSNKNDIIFLENDSLLPMFIIKHKQWHELFNSNEFNVSLQNGFGNGYVCIPSWHPYYLLNYVDIPVDVHGGLSYSAYDKEKDMWVIGFDTFHYNDNIDNNDNKQDLLYLQYYQYYQYYRYMLYYQYYLTYKAS